MSGLYRDTIKPKFICCYLLEVLFITCNAPVFGDVNLTSVEIDNQLLTYHLHGLATEKGVRLIRSYKNEALAQTSKLMGNTNISSPLRTC